MYGAREGYDIASSRYERWRWFTFWRRNEAPLVEAWLRSLRPGFGLDVGAGTGSYLPEIAGAKQRYIGIDLSLRMVEEFRERSLAFRGCLVGSVQADAVNLPFASERFDWLLSTRVLSHVRDIPAAFREFHRLLRAGGDCLISDVHPDHPYVNVSIPTEVGQIAIETHKHPVMELRRSASGAGLRIVSLSEFRLTDLPWKPPVEFERVYSNSDRPIFLVCTLKKG